jgi:hypothetical protein
MKSSLLALRAFVIGLALALAVFACPAEGFVFHEQRDPSPVPLPELSPQPHQSVIDLSGAWEYRLGKKGPFYPTWVPGSFAGNDGIVSLNRTFILPDSLRPYNFQLYLPEINYQVEVWLNGGMVSSFTGCHLGFACDIGRDRLRFGASNEIVLKIDNTLSPWRSVPVRGQATSPENFGGIFAGVYLRGVPGWSVEDAGLVQSVFDDSTALRTSVRVRIAEHGAPTAGYDTLRSPAPIHLAISIQDSAKRVIAEGKSETIERGGSESFQTVIPLPRFAASLWSPDHPTNYFLVATLVAGNDTLHRFTRRVGFKSAQVRGKDLYLNGQLLRVKGMDYIPEAVRGGRAISSAQMREDLRKMRDLGINAIRVPFSAPPPELVSLADQMGFLVFVEAGLDWIPNEVLARKDYRNLVWHTVDRILATYRDHVSVFAWGLGSRLDWKESNTQEFSQWLRQAVRAQDSRPCYIERGQVVDVAGFADFVLIARNPDNGLAPDGESQGSSVPMLISRVGRLAAFEDSEGDASSSGIVNQAEYLIRQVQSLDGNAAVSGYFIHCYADYHGVSPLLTQPNQHEPLLYTYGIVELNREERIAYSKLRDLAHTGQASPPMPAGTSDPAPIAFPVTGLAALILLSIEMRRNNVFRQNLKRVFLHAHGFYSDLRYRRFLHTAQPLILGLLESVTLSLIVSSFLFTVRSSFSLDYYLTHFLPWPSVKSWLVNLIWDPVQLILVFTIVFLVLILLQTLLVRLTSLFFRERSDFWQSANYVIWAFAALLYLLPLGVIFYRVILMPTFAEMAFIAVAAGLIWSFLRLIAALKTGFGSAPWRIYSTVLGIGVLIVTVMLIILEKQLGTLTYLQFFHDVFVAR